MLKEYGQFCGLAKATSLLGERWTLLVMRDLSVGPRRFKDLQEGLPGIPTSLLTGRLRELEKAGAVARRAGGLPDGGVLYGLTPRGAELTPILDALGRWGARTMATPESEDVITDSSLAAALRAGYVTGAVGVAQTYLVRAGTATAWARAEPDRVAVGEGRPATAPDLVIHGGPQLRMLLAGRLSPAEAIAAGELEIEGPQPAFEAFARAFHVPLDESVATA